MVPRWLSPAGKRKALSWQGKESSHQGKDANEQARVLWDSYAPRYDQHIRVSERLLSPTAGPGPAARHPAGRWRSLSGPA